MTRKLPGISLAPAEWPAPQRTAWEESEEVRNWPSAFRAEVARVYGSFLSLPPPPQGGIIAALDAFLDQLPAALAESSAVKYTQLLAYAVLAVHSDPGPGQHVYERYRDLYSARVQPPAGEPPPPPRVYPRLSLPFDEWGEDDRARWQRGTTPPKVSLTERFRRRAERQAPAIADDEATPLRRPPWQWSVPYSRAVQRGWGMYLYWRQAAGYDGAVTPEAIEAFVEACAGRPGCRSLISIATYLQEIYVALRVMRPEDDWIWLREDWQALDQMAEPVRDKLANYVPVDELYAFAIGVMAEAMRRPATPRNAIRFRDGYFLALACLRPKRVRNLGQIRVGQELLLNADGRPRALVFSGTKNGDPAENPFPPELVEFHHAWWTRFRPALSPAADLPDLWIGRDGRPLDVSQFWPRLARLTEARFGKRVGPHMIRTCYATFFAVATEAPLALVSRMLDHRDPRSIAPYQLMSRSVVASRALNGAVESLLRRYGITPAANRQQATTAGSARRLRPSLRRVAA